MLYQKTTTKYWLSIIFFNKRNPLGTSQKDCRWQSFFTFTHKFGYCIMKYSQQIGAFAAIVLMGACFLPWITISNPPLIVSGFATKGTSFGKPGILHIFFSVIMLVLFLLPRIWAKRVNLFIGALNVAWGFKNYLLYSACMGICPDKQIGLWLVLLSSATMLLMSLLPKIALKQPI